MSDEILRSSLFAALGGAVLLARFLGAVFGKRTRDRVARWGARRVFVAALVANVLPTVVLGARALAGGRVWWVLAGFAVVQAVLSIAVTFMLLSTPGKGALNEFEQAVRREGGTAEAAAGSTAGTPEPRGSVSSVGETPRRRSPTRERGRVAVPAMYGAMLACWVADWM